MFNNFSSYWERNGFLILLVSSVVFILGCWFFNNLWTKDHGTFSTNVDYVVPPTNIEKYRMNRPKPSNGGGKAKDSKGETACREYLQRRFGKPFPKIRPDFLFNSVTGNNLELDMYNKELLLACEYHGRQHYEYCPFFHRNSRDTFRNQQYRDKMKTDACKKLGIRLIVVPYTVTVEDIPKFIEKEIEKFGIK